MEHEKQDVSFALTVGQNGRHGTVGRAPATAPDQ